MNLPLRLRALWLVPWLSMGLLGQVPKLPIELRPDLETLNWSSKRGAPLSNTANTPPGSDGRAPAEGAQLPPLPTTAATPRQYSGFMSFGSGVRPVYSTQVNTNRSLVANAVALDLPRLGGNTPTHILLRARVGSPLVTRGFSYLFGSIIPPPDVDETGKLLSESNRTRENYWGAEPYSTNGHAGASYYWSPNARAVFATRPGPVDITWKRLNGLSSQPTNSAVQESGLWYTLYTQRVLVSGSLSKPSRVIYWTQGDFSKVGKPVQVPGNRVSDIKVVFNDQIPERVDREYSGGSQIVNTNRLEETRTLWFDRSTSQILAYNSEGRVFVELLGDADPNGLTRKHLGFEIVDVLKQATPQTVTVSLGDRLKAFADPNRDDSMLYPEPLAQMGDRFLEINAPNTSAPSELYAVRETRNINDVLVYWMEDGVEGLRWPRVFSRYEMAWPSDPARYSHYLRPSVASKEEARQTAVLMNANNVPLLLYQDSLENPRAFLDPDLYFYTYLTPSMPAHRSLLRYNSGNKMIFERVFSWLDANLTATNWGGTVAASLSSWNRTNSTMTFPTTMDSPRIVSETVDVGRRLAPPSGEIGADGSAAYLAGYIRSGTAYHPGAYRNPFVDGFEAANKSAIIPVNAIPGTNTLEVWWFRQSSVLVQQGLSPIAWPAVMGRYTVQYPTSPREIVLASNAGTGPLTSVEARGSIYVQNDPLGIGYNPNEEHALMIGGQGYALRDDLNITSGANYSSQPFVLVDYVAEDGRPSMSAFRVLREKPSSGLIFDYVVEAGRILQPPMPLPLLQPPTEGEGVGLTNYNREIAVASGSGNLPVNWSENRDGTGAYRHYKTFSYLDRKNSFWVYRGLHQEPNLQSGRYISTNRTYTNLPAAVAISGRAYKYYIHTVPCTW